MEQRRLDKINELLHRFISQLLKEELEVDALVTVANVKTTANGQESVLSVTVYPFEKSGEALKQIQKQLYGFQQQVNRGLNMRPVPKIIFKIDESEEKGERVLKVIDQLKN